MNRLKLSHLFFFVFSFLLIAIPAAANADAYQPAQSPESAPDEFTDWLLTNQIDTREAYKNFVKRHPDGEYTAAAGDRIWELVENESNTDEDFDSAKAYQDFIRENPKSNFIIAAKAKLNDAQSKQKVANLDVRRKSAPYKPIGMYVGAQVGHAGSITSVSDASSTSALIGYDFNDTYSMELAYASLYKNSNANALVATMNSGNAGSTGSFSFNSYSLVGQYAFHLTDNTRLLGGIGIHESSYTVDSGNLTMYSGKSSGFVLGLKADYSLGKYVSLRAGVDIYNLGGDITGNITNFGAAALFKF